MMKDCDRNEHEIIFTFLDFISEAAGGGCWDGTGSRVSCSVRSSEALFTKVDISTLN